MSNFAQSMLLNGIDKWIVMTKLAVRFGSYVLAFITWIISF